MTRNPCKTASCVPGACQVADRPDNTSCVPNGPSGDFLTATPSCSGRCQSGSCEMTCAAPVGPALPPAANRPCSTLNCATVAAGAVECVQTGAITATNAVTMGPNGEPVCACNCLLPSVTRPAACTLQTFTACFAALPQCERDNIALNGVGLLRDEDSCCGSCKTGPGQACYLADHVACVQNQRVCNNTAGERPLFSTSGACCRSCAVQGLAPLPLSLCGSNCTGANRACVPFIDRQGYVRPDLLVCRRVLRRNLWVPRLGGVVFTDERATAYFRAMLERAHQAAGIKLAKLLHWWNVAFAQVSSACSEGKRPAASADCLALSLVVPVPPQQAGSSAVARAESSCTDCAPESDYNEVFDRAIQAAAVTGDGVQPTNGARLSVGWVTLALLALWLF